MSTAVRFLVFADVPTDNPNADDIDYARRHVNPLFGDLLNRRADEGGVEERCMPPSLKGIAMALRLLAPDGRYTRQFAEPDHVYDTAVTVGQPSRTAFPLMTRVAYADATGCVVSPGTWDKYRVAVEWVVLGQRFPEEAEAAMRGFLQDLQSGRPAQGGFVHADCMTPEITRIAAPLNLLDDQGRYRAEP